MAHPAIRAYRPADRDACRALWVALTEYHCDLYADPSIGGDTPADAFDCYLATPTLQGPWLATLQDRVIGFTGLFVTDTDAEIEPVIVARSYRGQGVGRCLVEHAVGEARRFGIQRLHVNPAARNADAIAFFISLGFDSVSRLDLVQRLTPQPDGGWKLGLRVHGHDLLL